MKRSGPLVRRSPLVSRTGLQRRTPLRQVSVKRAAAAGRPARPRDTGPDRTTRELVAERDQYCCVGCGRQLLTGPRSLQHRKARGAGGTSDPAVNRPSNLIWLCGTATTPDSCHLAAESRTEQTRTAGLWVPSWADPAKVPVWHAPINGWVLLDDNGELTTCTPPEENE